MAFYTENSKNSSIITQLQNLVNDIDRSCNSGLHSYCGGPCCHSCCNFPFHQVIMTVPAPILAPTRPEAVKPSSLPCPQTVCKQLIRGERDISGDRYDNFYNNYNINSTESCESKPWTCDNFSPKRFGVTVDGKSPCCDVSKREDDRGPLHGYPTGFKSCTMKLTPPPYCDPFLPWCAEIQPCPPKSKKKKRTVC